MTYACKIVNCATLCVNYATFLIIARLLLCVVRTSYKTGLGESVTLPQAPYLHRMPMSRPADMPIDC